MYECLIKNRNGDGSTSYEYWCDEGRPKCPHIPIPEGAEYFICHEGCYNKELIFSKNNFGDAWSVTYDQTKWINSDWDDDIDDRLEYMKEHYGSVILWKREEEMNEEYPDDLLVVTQNNDTILYWYDDGKVRSDYEIERRVPMHKSYLNYLNEFPNAIVVYKREDKLMFEDEYLLTKLQACDVLLNEPEILQCESVDGSWFDIDWKSYHVQNIILDKESKCKLRIKPSLEHVPIEFCEVMDMLADGKVNEIFVSKGNQLSKLETPLYYLQYRYHDKYSRVVEKQVTYDQWKNCKKGEENV